MARTTVDIPPDLIAKIKAEATNHQYSGNVSAVVRRAIAEFLDRKKKAAK